MDRPQSPSSPAQPAASEMFAALTHYGAIDWAKDHHDACVIDAAGRVVLKLRFDQTPEGWALLRGKVAALQGPDGSAAVVGFAIETSSGPAVERLLEAGYGIFPLNPKSAERFRDRKAPCGAKDDQLDAYSFADALRTDGHGWASAPPGCVDLRVASALPR